MATPSGRVVLARHETPTGEIQLQQRALADGSLAFEIIANGVFLMASYNHVSSQALADYALEIGPTDPTADRRVLVGGLGMGFTLQAALTYQEVTVEVVEISPHIITWNRTHLAPLNDHALADPRVSLIQADLYSVMDTSPADTYEAILLDVDNGPSWLAHEANARLYTAEALERWSDMLLPGGRFAVWSAQAEPEFFESMQVGFAQAEEIPVVVQMPQRERVVYFIYLGICS